MFFAMLAWGSALFLRDAGFLSRPSVNSLCLECKWKSSPHIRARSLRQTSRTISKSAVPEGSQLDIFSGPTSSGSQKYHVTRKHRKRALSSFLNHLQEAGSSAILQWWLRRSFCQAAPSPSAKQPSLGACPFLLSGEHTLTSVQMVEARLVEQDTSFCRMAKRND